MDFDETFSDSLAANAIMYKFAILFYFFQLIFRISHINQLTLLQFSVKHFVVTCSGRTSNNSSEICICERISSLE
jgi:hypothetical protein